MEDIYLSNFFIFYFLFLISYSIISLQIDLNIL